MSEAPADAHLKQGIVGSCAYVRRSVPSVPVLPPVRPVLPPPVPPLLFVRLSLVPLLLLWWFCRSRPSSLVKFPSSGVSRILGYIRSPRLPVRPLPAPSVPVLLPPSVPVPSPRPPRSAPRLVLFLPVRFFL